MIADWQHTKPMEPDNSTPTGVYDFLKEAFQSYQGVDKNISDRLLIVVKVIYTDSQVMVHRWLPDQVVMFDMTNHS